VRRLVVVDSYIAQRSCTLVGYAQVSRADALAARAERLGCPSWGGWVNKVRVQVG